MLGLAARWFGCCRVCRGVVALAPWAIPPAHSLVGGNENCQCFPLQSRVVELVLERFQQAEAEDLPALARFLLQHAAPGAELKQARCCDHAAWPWACLQGS